MGDILFEVSPSHFVKLFVKPDLLDDGQESDRYRRWDRRNVDRTQPCSPRHGRDGAREGGAALRGRDLACGGSCDSLWRLLKNQESSRCHRKRPIARVHGRISSTRPHGPFRAARPNVLCMAVQANRMDCGQNTARLAKTLHGRIAAQLVPVRVRVYVFP